MSSFIQDDRAQSLRKKLIAQRDLCDQKAQDLASGMDGVGLDPGSVLQMRLNYLVEQLYGMHMDGFVPLGQTPEERNADNGVPSDPERIEFELGWFALMNKMYDVALQQKAERAKTAQGQGLIIAGPGQMPNGPMG